MSDEYRAIYDAVRSRMCNSDPDSVMRNVLYEVFDVSYVKAVVQESLLAAIAQYDRPSVRMRPAISKDGNQWCMLYGEDLQNGVAGFGDTPEDAAQAFDEAWTKLRLNGGQHG